MKLKFKGVNFEITFLFAAFVALAMTLNVPTNVIVTLISSFFHEMGHLLVMCAVGNVPQSVRLELTGINIKRHSSTAISLKNELLISLGGPLVNALLLVICLFGLCFRRNEILLTAACVNLILMTFNLLPVKRLDGGTALFFLLSRKYSVDICEKILKITSCFFIFAIYLWGVWVLAATHYNISVLTVAVFLTLSMLSSNEY